MDARGQGQGCMDRNSRIGSIDEGSNQKSCPARGGKEAAFSSRLADRTCAFEAQGRNKGLWPYLKYHAFYAGLVFIKVSRARSGRPGAGPGGFLWPENQCQGQRPAAAG